MLASNYQVSARTFNSLARWTLTGAVCGSCSTRMKACTTSRLWTRPSWCSCPKFLFASSGRPTSTWSPWSPAPPSASSCIECAQIAIGPQAQRTRASVTLRLRGCVRDLSLVYWWLGGLPAAFVCTLLRSLLWETSEFWAFPLALSIIMPCRRFWDARSHCPF